MCKSFIRSALRLTLLLFLVSGSVACTAVDSAVHHIGDAADRLGVSARDRVERSSHWVLPAHSRLHVVPMTAHDQATGDFVSALLASNLNRHFPYVSLGVEAQPIEQARVSALAMQADYLLYPRLVLWHDDPGNWSELSVLMGDAYTEHAMASLANNRAQVQIVVIEARGGRVVDTVTIEAHSGISTPLGSHRTGRLLDGAMGAYVNSIAAWQHPGR